MSDFNILIGVDLANAESQIKDMIQRAGSSYKLNLEATMDNKQLKLKMGEINKLKATIEKFKINVDASSLNSLDKTANKVGKTIEHSMDAVGRNAQSYEESLKESEKTIGRIQKISQKTNIKSGKKTSTEKKGNEFISKTIQYDISTKDVKEEFNELSREITKDFKGLEKYIDKLTDETEGWKHVAGLLPEEFEELKSTMLSLNGLMQDDPMGFDSALRRVKKLQVELSRLEAMTVNKFQGLSKIEAMSKTSDLSKVKPSQKKEQEESLESLRNKATQKDVGDGDYSKMLNDWIQKNTELSEQNKKNITIQKEVDKLTKNIGSNIEEWKNSGNLAKEEIKSFENELKTLDVLSDSFDSNLKKISEDLKRLSNQDKDIAEQKLDKEKAIAKATSERISWQKKINDLEREGYTHNGQMKAMNDRLEKLDAKKVTSLKEVNKLLGEMNIQYAKAQIYQKNTKFANKKSAKANEFKGDVEKNLNPEIVGSEGISEINDQIKKLHQADSVEQLNRATDKVSQTYDELLTKQNLVIQGRKEEALTQESLTKSLDKYLNKLESIGFNANKQLSDAKNIEAIEQRILNITEQINERKLKNEKLSYGEQQSADKELLALNRVLDSHRDSEASIKKQVKEAEKLQKQLDKENADKILEKENTIAKVIRERASWQKKINDLEREGYTHNGQMKALNTRLEKLDENKITSLKEVNKLLGEMNIQYSKAQTYQKNTKFANRKSEKVSELNGKVKDLDQDIVGSEGIRNINDEIKKLQQTDTVEKFNNATAKVLNIYDELLAKQKLVLQGRKEEAQRISEEQTTQQNLTKSLDKYLRKLEEVGYNTNKNLNDSKNIEAIELRILAITEQINERKLKNVSLEYTEQQALDKELLTLNRVLTSHKEAEASIKRQVNQAEQLQKQLESVAYRATRGVDSPRENRELKGDIRAIEGRVQDLNVNASTLSVDEFEKEIKSISKDFDTLNAKSRMFRDDIREINNNPLNKFMKAMKSVPVWASAMGLFYASINAVQQGFQSLLDVDKAMVELGKVTDATGEQLANFESASHDIGNSLGVLSSDVINATADFQKLGYSLEQASILGQNSILYAKVGDMDLDTSTQHIISTVKGFGIEIDKSGNSIRSLVDMMNEVGNNYSITATGIGEALRRSSATLSEAGNSVEQAVGIVTAANSTIQDPERVGTALKTISMRLRGVEEDGSSITGLAPKLEKVFNSFGESIMLDENTFKSTFDIMDTLSNKWETLSDMERANLVYLIGGMEQGSIVSAMINNWTDATDSYETALNSAGSAQREINNTMDGYEFKIGRLKNAVETFWITLADDEFIKGAIDGLTKMVELATQLVDVLGSGQITGQLIGIATLIGSKRVRKKTFGKKENEDNGTSGGDASSVASTATAVAVENMASRSGKATSKAGDIAMKAGSKFASSALAIGTWVFRLAKFTSIVGAVSLGLELITKALTFNSDVREANIKKINDEITAYESLQSKYKENNVDRYVELQTKGVDNLNTEELDEYHRLELQIIENMPELVSHYDDQRNAVLMTAEQIKHLREESEKLNLSNRKDAFEFEVKDTDFSNINKKIKQVQDAMNKQDNGADNIEAFGFLKNAVENDLKGLNDADVQYEEKVQKIKEVKEEFMKLLGDDAFSADMENQFVLIEQKLSTGDTNGAIKMIEDNMNMIKSSVKSAKTELGKSEIELDSASKDFKEKVKTAFQIAMDEKGIDPGSNQWKFIEKMQDDLIKNIAKMSGNDVEETINNVPEMINNAFEAIKGTGINMADLFVTDTDKNSISELRGNFAIVIDGIKGTDDKSAQLRRSLELLRDAQLDTANSMANNQIEPFGNFSTEVAPTVTTFTDEIAGLDNAYRQLSEGQKLSSTQIIDLITQYPELTKHLSKQNGVLTLSKKGIKELAKVKEAEFKTDLEIKLKEAKAAEAKTKAVLKGLTQEIKGIKHYDDAKVKSYKAEANRMIKDGNSFSAMGDPRGALMIQQGEKLKKELDTLTDYQDEINAIKVLMDFDFTSNLGKISDNSDFKTTEPKKDKKEKEKEDKQYQDSIYIVDEYTKKIDELNSSIEKLKLQRENYVDYGKKFQDSIKQEIKLSKEKKKAIDAEIKSLEKQIKTGNIKDTGIIDNGTTTDKNANNNTSKKITGSSNAEKAFNFFVSQGFSNQASAGIVGNLQQESSAKLDPKIKQIGGGDGRGIAQWDKNRWSQLQAWAKKNKKEVYSLETQLEFIIQELKGASGTDKATKNKLAKLGGLTKLKNNKDIKDATRDFQESFERAGKPKYNDRYAYAEKAYKNYKGSGVTNAKKTTQSASATTAKNYLDKYYITDGFNARGGAHKGLDLNLKGTTGNGDKGTPIKNIKGGKVTTVFKNNPTAGNAIIIKGDDGKTYQYNHMESAPKYKKGDKVSAGDILGKIGNTGSGEYAHLDLKIKDENGKYIDPKKYLQQLAKGTSNSITTGITETLRKGSTGADVKKLQKELGISADGIYGNDTVSAVKKYQKKNGLTADGIAGTKTLKKMGLQKTTKTTSKDDNKTKGSKEAEKLDKIAQAEKRLLELREESLSQQNAIYELNELVLESKISAYEHDRSNLDDNIAYAEYAMSLYDTSSKKYKYYADTKISRLKELQKSHKAELDFLEKELKTNKDLSAQAKNELKDKIVQKRIDVYDANSNVQDEKNNLADIALEKIFDKHQRELDAYAKKIDQLRNKIKYDVEDDKPLAKQLKEQQDTVASNKNKVTTTSKDLTAEKKLLKTQENNIKSLTATEKRITALKKEILKADKTTKKKLQDELKQHEKVLKIQKAQAKDLATTKKNISSLDKSLSTSNKKLKTDNSAVTNIKNQIKAQEKLLKSQKTAKGKAKVQKKIDGLENDLKVANKRVTLDKKNVNSIKEKIKAQKELLKLQTSAYDASKVKAYEKKIKTLNTNLTKEEKNKKKHSSAVKVLEDDLKLMKSLQKRQTTKEGKAKFQGSIKGIEKELAKAKKVVKADEDRIKKIKAQIKEQQKLLSYQTNKKQSTANIDATKKAITGLEKDLTNANKALTASEKELNETVIAKRGEIPILKEILSVSKGTVLDLKKQIKESQKLEKTYKNNNELLAKAKAHTEDLKKQLEDAENAVKDLNQEIEDAYEDLADTIVDQYIEQLELMQKAEDKKYTEFMKKKEKEHEKVMEDLNEEMEMLQKIYQQKIDNIDKTESTDSFNKDISKMEEEARKLNEEIAKLSLDDSYEAKAKNTDLKKQLTELETQMEERKHDREIELRKNNLADDLEADQEALQSKIDKNQDEYDDYIENQEKIKETRDQYWEDELNDERKQAELRKLILDGNFKEVEELTKKWSENISGDMDSIGKSISLNFIDKVAEAKAQLELLNGIKLGSLKDTLNVDSTNINGEKKEVNENRDSGSVTGSLEKESGDKAKAEQAKKEAEAKAKKEKEAKAKKEAEAKAKAKKEAEAKAKNEKETKAKRYYVVKKGDTLSEIAEKYYGKASQWTKIQKANPSVNPNSMKIGTKLLIPFRSGGYTGDWSGDSGRLAVLHKKELVLNAQQTSDILSTAKIMDKIKGALPNINNISNIQQPATEINNDNTVNNNYEINVHVENMSGDKKSADIVAEQILMNMKRTRGGRF